MDCCEEVSGKLVKALGETTHIFHAAKEPFHQIALTIKPFVICPGAGCIGAVRNDWNRAFVNNGPSIRRAVVAFVGTYCQRRPWVVHKPGQDRSIMNLAARQDEVEWSSQSVDHGMDFRRATAA